MMNTKTILISGLIALNGGYALGVNSSSYDVSGKTYYVSATAEPEGDGSRARPFATLEEARDLVRSEMLETMTPPDGAVIQLDAGVYYRTGRFEMNHHDAFPAYSQLTIQGAEDGGTIIHMGKRVALDQLQAITDVTVLNRLRPEARNKVKMIDLAAVGIDLKPLPVLYKGLDGGQPEVFFNDARLPISRYPNEGTLTMGELVSPGIWWGGRSEGGVFKFKDDRHLDWMAAVDSGLWLNGFWRTPWQSHSIRVESIDPDTKKVTHAVPISEGASENSKFAGIGSKYTRPNGSLEEPYFAFNLLEEIDQPGEWSIDFKERKLYVWLPREQGELVIGHNAEPLFELKGTSQVKIRNLTFKGGRENGIEIFGGVDNVVEECTFVNLGGWGVVVRGGFRNGVNRCHFTELGKGGIEISGGDPVNLVRCDNFATHNTLHGLCRLQKTWTGAIKLGVTKMHGGSIGTRQAVGIRINDNEIYDLPQMGILAGGNFNEIMRNEIYDIGKETHDVGYVYTRHDWTSRGNVMSDNLFYGTPHAHGFHLDDGECGDLLERNVIIGSKNGVQIGGGHYNTIRNNHMIDCEKGIHLDDRGVRRNYTMSNGKKVFEFKITERAPEVWHDHFPELKELESDKPEWPKGNVLVDNHFVRCKETEVLVVKTEGLLDTIQSRNTIENNTVYNPDAISRDHSELVEFYRTYLKQNGKMPARMIDAGGDL
ncbi:right-handed parallel beta-helix repeat-containing protein [Pontiellaceae bacterium B12227]|nr:right-handed parallel beta-helix repeat-containing protein [Pontiellaceae bacterium B12227]